MTVKVCHITSVHRPEDTRIFHKECVSLSNAGYEVWLVEQGRSYEKNGVFIKGFGPQEKSRIQRMRKDARKSYEIAYDLDCDIYHLHDPELLPYVKHLKRQGKKVVFDCHENVYGTILEKPWIPTLVRKPVASAYLYVQKSVCSDIDAVIVATDYLEEFFLGICPRVITVTNFPAYRESAPVSKHEGTTMVFAGGISQQWNIHHLIEGMDDVPGCVLKMCGKADDSYLKRLRSLPGWRNVEYDGLRPHDEMPSFLASGDIGLALLSYGNNTNNMIGNWANTKLFEEMMAELPVICTDFKIWSDIVRKNNCGLYVNPTNVYEIKEAIRWLVSNPEDAKSMGKNGRRAVKYEYNWASQEEKLLNLYENLAYGVC